VPLTSRRNLLGQLGAVDVDTKGAQPNVSDEIQLVYVLDDLSRLVAPASPVEAFVNIGVPADAVRVSGIELRAPPNSAIVVTWMRNDTAIATLYQVGGLLVLSNNLVAGVVDFTTGPGSAAPGTRQRGTYQHGSKADQTVGLSIAANSALDDRHPDLVIEPGLTLLWVGDTINTGVQFQFSWREIPV